MKKIWPYPVATSKSGPW